MTMSPKAMALKSRPTTVSRGYREALRADGERVRSPVKITKKIAAVSVASAALAGAGVSAGIALTSPGAPAHHVAHLTSQHAKAAHPTATAVARTHVVHKAHAVAAVKLQAPAGQAQAQAQANDDQASGASQTSQAAGPVPAGASAFEQCVAWRESTDTPTDPDGLFGILPSTWAQLGYSGTAGQAPVWLQQIAFNRLYAEYGAQPWAPSDGC